MWKRCCHHLIREDLVGKKKLRRREPDEDGNGRKYKRQCTIYICTKCSQSGHNNRSCKSAVVNPYA